MSLSMEGKVASFACFSRIIVILLQILFNQLIPDHKNNVFNPPLDPSRYSLDKVVTDVLGGFRRWDSQYFLHIAEYGYAYDNSLAFFPLYPLIVRVIALSILYPLHYVMSSVSVFLIAGVIVNFIFFILAAKMLYKLSLKVLNDSTLAYKSALLFCINPASVFMSAAYSETVFAYIGFSTMLYYQTRSYFWSAFYTSFCGLTRSNGITFTGFMLYAKFKELILQLRTIRSANMEDWKMSLGASAATSWLLLGPTVIYFIISLAPFALYQVYAYLIFCNKDFSPKIPLNVEWYGQERNYTMVGIKTPEWCHLDLPLSYSYIQQHHWDVGLLKYYEIKQIPNFFLAAPVILLSLAAVWYYYRINSSYVLTLGFRDGDYELKKKDKKPRTGFESLTVFVFIVHMMVLLVFGILFMHIQVLTRFLFSSSPVLYWFVAMVCTPEDHVVMETSKWDIASNLHKPQNVENERNASSKIRNLLLDQMWTPSMNSLKTNVLLGYFISYFIVGIALHVNFLPWT